MRGKEICNFLRQIRQQIAKDNGIPYTTDECKYQGECSGTCPKCDSEASFLNEEIRRRGINITKFVAATGLTLALSSCDTTNPNLPVRGKMLSDTETEHLQGDVKPMTNISASGPKAPTSPRTPSVICHYTNYGSVRGEVPYEPNPTSKTIAEHLEKLIVYPDSMIQAGIEVKVILCFNFDKEGIARNIEVRDSPNMLFASAVTDALKKLDRIILL